MALDPQAKAVLDLMAAAGLPPLHERTPEEARLGLDVRPLAGPPPEVGYIQDTMIVGTAGAIPARIYVPTGHSEADGCLPALVYFHGGGWVIGNLDAADVPCRHLASKAGCVVVSVEYRKAPEHKFPAAADDAYAAVKWLKANADTLNVDATRIAVGGDSAGGNLAAVVALMARDRGDFSICHQMLVYPVTNHGFETGSYRDNAEGYFLTRDGMAWFWNHYLAEEADGEHPYASPLRAGNLAGLPPALVITAEFDPLRDEGEAYAARLADAGVPVLATRYDGMIHGFFWMPGVMAQAGKAFDQCAQALRKAFGEERA
ncbi:acetylhydrolase [Cupriavidus sp. TKC]|uniref:alpha/beta hydrolase n=1 Tax=Cupriavidus sp. TKC TaxID=2880159 RepID=UPI0025A834E5|nr:alpha/beta hydrolase [Cupriavidus sp. TKC]GMG90532.1 acetylhydrolase [Cupriavidus sp. TKC]